MIFKIASYDPFNVKQDVQEQKWQTWSRTFLDLKKWLLYDKVIGGESFNLI